MVSLIFILLALPATTNPAPDYPNWTSFVVTVLPYLTVFGLIWKCIDRVFEYLGRKTKDQMIEVTRSYINPLLDEMREERRRDSDKVNDKLKDIQSSLDKRVR